MGLRANIKMGLVAVLLSLTPFAVAAAEDTNVEAVSISNQTSTSIGVGSSYTMDLFISDAAPLASGEIIYFGVIGTVGDTAATSGFNFDGVTDSGDVSGAGGMYNNGEYYALTTDAELAANSTNSVTLNGVVNSSQAGCFTFFVTTETPTGSFNFTESDVFGLGVGCSLPAVSVDAFGTNIGVSWDTYPNATSYTISYSPVEADFGVGALAPAALKTVTTSSHSKIFEDLVMNTKYFFTVTPNTGGSNSPVFTSPTLNATTWTKIEKDVFTQPRVPKKKIRKRSAVVRWDAPAASRFVTKYFLQLQTRKGKKLKIWRNIDSEKTTKTIPRKKFLRAGRRYKVRMRAQYVTGEKTLFGPFKYFKTKKAFCQMEINKDALRCQAS